MPTVLILLQVRQRELQLVIDADGKTDVIVTNTLVNTLSILPNKSAQGILNSSSLGSKVDFYIGLGNAPKNLAIGDLDGDGKLDVVTSNLNKGTLSIFRNTSTVTGSINSSTFAPVLTISLGTAPTDIKIADVDGDGRLDIVVLSAGNNTVSVFRNLGLTPLVRDSFSLPVDFGTGSDPEQLNITDLDGDAKPELIVVNTIDDTFSVLQNVSTAGSLSANSFADKVDFITGNSPVGLAVADFDGDGKKDIAITNNVTDNTISIFRNVVSNGVIAANSFAAKVDLATGNSPVGLAVGDLDGDSKPEIVAVNNADGTLSVYKNIATVGNISSSSFNQKIDFTTGANPAFVSIADIDGDGKPELIVTGNGSKSTVTILKNVLGDGIAIPPTIVTTPAAQTICSGTSTGITFTNPNAIAGTMYSWTVVTSPGLTGASSGSGATLVQTLTASTASETATYTITPSANGVSGTPIAVTISVINSTPPAPAVSSSLNYCQGSPTKALIATGDNLLWYSASSGGVGSSTAPVPSSSAVSTVSYFVSQTLSGCGESARSQIDVNVLPLASLSSSLAPQAICSGTAFSYTPTSATSGVSFSWKRANISGILPALGGGTGPINETLVNSTASPIVVDYKIVVTSTNGCTSAPQSLLVTINPLPAGMPIISAAISDQALGSPFTLATKSNSIGAQSYSVTAIATNGLIASAGNPVNGLGKSSLELTDDAWTNKSTSIVKVVYTIVPTSSANCPGLPFSVTANVQPNIVFDVALGTADLSAAANSESSLNNGINTEPIINSSSTDRVVLGTTLKLLNKITGLNEPFLNGFSIGFSNPYNGILKNFRIYQSADASFDIKKDVLVSSTLTLSNKSVQVQLTAPHDLSLGAVTYFLLVDVDPSASVSTLPISASLSRSSISMSKGAVSGADVVGRTYSFIDNTPPLAIKVTPSNGAVEVLGSTALSIEFNEIVTSLDGMVSIFTLDRRKIADLVLPKLSPTTGTLFIFPTNGVLTNGTTYYATIKAGDANAKTGFVDNAGNGFLGYSKISEWAFTTNDPRPPKFVKTGAKDKTPFLKNDFLDSTLVGGTLQVVLDKVGKVYYLVTPSPSVQPTFNQVFDATKYPNTVVASSYVSVIRDSAFQFGSLSATLMDGISYDIWLAGENSTGVRMSDAAIEKITFVAGDPILDINKPLLIISEPKINPICLGDYQTLPFPISISERSSNDFPLDPIVNSVRVDQNFNIILPVGFEFNAKAPKDTVIGIGADIAIKSFSYVSNSVLSVVYSISATATRDRIIIQGLQIKATGTVNTLGRIYRVGGNGLKQIPDFTTVGVLRTYSISPIPLDIYDIATNSSVTVSIANNVTKLSLRPHVDKTMYGSNIFSGDGVIDDELFPAAAGLGLHTLQLMHTDVEGCVASSTKRINVYDFTKAVDGLDTLYNINSPLKVKIKKDGKGKGVFYRLDSLILIIPPNTSNNFGLPVSQALSAPDAAGTYTFDPSVFNTLINRKKFGAVGGRLGTLLFVGRYKNLVTNLSEIFIQSVGVYVPPQTAVGVVDKQGRHTSDVYCEDLGTVKLIGFPQPGDDIIGFFTLNNVKPAANSGLLDPLDGNASLSTQTIKKSTGYGTYTIRYIAQNVRTNGSDTTAITIKISPKPLANFMNSIPCVSPDTVKFENMSAMPADATTGSVTNYLWDFGDDKAIGVNRTSINANTNHVFTDARTYSVSLTATSDLGCSSDPIVKTIKVGANPVANFSFTGVSTTDPINFTDFSTVAFDNIVSRKWDFGNKNDSLIAATTFNRKFSTAGVYNVKLTIISSIGCVRSKVLKVGVVPRQILTTTYQENFEAGDGGWQTLRSPANTGLVPSWKRTSSNAIINSTINNKAIWKTENFNDTYDQSEISYLYSPAFDFSALSRPVISFNLYHQMDVKDSPNALDGVVLQYSIDDRNIADSLKDWKSTLGAFSTTSPSGYNWYTGQGLPSKPGNQSKGDYGWTKSDSIAKWREARHALDTIGRDVNNPSKIDLNVRKKIVFRFALGSTDKVKAGVGFALDNVRLGSRTRTILLENFRSLSNTKEDARGNIEKAEGSVLRDSTKLGKNVATGIDVVRMNYHLNFPNNDPFNLDNPNDPSARALYYNITQTPRVRMDGTVNGNGKLFSTWTNQFRLEALKLASADIKITAQTTTKGSIQASVTVVATNGSLPKESTVLLVAVVEQKILKSVLSSQQRALDLTNDNAFDFVVKKLLPTTSGTKLTSDLQQNSSQTFGPFEWIPEPTRLYPASTNAKPNLAVVAFLQNGVTKEIYQSAMVLNLNYPAVVTGLDDMGVDDISIYPLPANKQLTISLPNPSANTTELQFIDQLGRSVMNDFISAGQQSKVIATEHLSEGL